VTSFAGKVNNNPTSNVSNSTADLADAYFYKPEGLAWDGNGNMYVTESNKIRLIANGKVYNRSGKIGDPSFSLGYKNGPGNAGSYYGPTGAVCDASGNVFIVDDGNHAIRKLTKFVNVGDGQIVSTFAGGAPSANFGQPGYKDGTGTAARFEAPKGIAMDKNGNMYVTDFLNDCIRKITPSGVVTTLAGKAGETGSTDASGGANARFNSPYGIAMYDDNHIVVTDFGTPALRKVNINNGGTTTIVSGFPHIDGSLANGGFRSPRGIAVVDGLIYVADNTTIRVIDEANKTISTFAGSKSATGNVDGVGLDARFGILHGLAYDGGNALYVTDQTNHIIKKVTIDNLAPKADFSATKTNIEVNEETTLTDISGGKPATKRSWKVEANSGGTSNVVIVQGDLNKDKDITVKFTATGVYKVTLNVTNEYGKDEVTKALINVSTVGIETIELLSLNVYPNPVTGNTITLNLSEGSFNQGELMLLDIHGKVVDQEIAYHGSQHTMVLPDLPKGIYFLNVRNNGMIGSRRIMIQ
jgi:PKD repeat protein